MIHNQHAVVDLPRLPSSPCHYDLTLYIPPEVCWDHKHKTSPGTDNDKEDSLEMYTSNTVIMRVL